MNFLAVALMWMAMQQAPKQAGNCAEYPRNCVIYRDPTPAELAAREPMDVPAVEDTVQTFDNVYACSHVLEMYSPWRGYYCEIGNKGWKLRHGICTDKSRILLTAEDDTKHCLKFPK